MFIGIPKEIKNNENRVSLTPAGVVTLLKGGHTVIVETKAGLGSGFSDEDYLAAGAKIVSTSKEAWNQEMIIKVKEPLESEYNYFKEGLILFTYLHLAPNPILTKALVASKVISIAYETIQLEDNSLPLLIPMSEVAGRLAPQVAAEFLHEQYGGKGILLSGVTGTPRGNISIIGGGIAGLNAIKTSIGLGANVTVLDISANRLAALDNIFGNTITTLISNPYNIANAVKSSDIVIGAVLIPGAAAPKLVTEEMVKSMEKGSVLIDIAIDQGGIFETSDKVTTHENPIFEKHGVLHYTVANMPGVVPRTSTIALTNATLPYASQLANKGYKKALKENKALLLGLNTMAGKVTYKAVATSQNLEYTNPESLLK
ncbi:alanine dehydrogenase [uncultured Clostridium sp.]|jgi:alanine dehydrogenase|uniref:alanine dehydrogenase n=1 Tax=uncultured Clostridium sp. TaxID=59620 RepID=UPI0026098AA1|nr:alanine dehydrogenase [uncultured Clostridium sp.]